MQEDRPYHIQAICDLNDDYSAEHFRAAVGECRKIISLVIADDDSSDQQVARVRILRYLDLQLSRATRWVEKEADLMAVVLRSQIELRLWADFVCKGSTESAKFLHEVTVDIKELHTKQDKAFPNTLPPMPVMTAGKRMDLKRTNDAEEYDFKLCSKLIHPTALMLNHPEQTIGNPAYKKYLGVEVLFYGWLILNRFHDIAWHD